MARCSSSTRLGYTTPLIQSEMVSGSASILPVVGSGLAVVNERERMERDHAHVGMLVRFGRDGEASTIARILKVNPARAKVIVIDGCESKPVGSKWNVPYALMTPVREATVTEQSELPN